MSSRVLIEREPNYTYASARLLLDSMRREALTFIYDKEFQATSKEMEKIYPDYFKGYMDKAVGLSLIDKDIASLFDLNILAKALLPERDLKFTYLGLQTLYDRYFIHSKDIRFELPQAFFMRVAMGLACNEEARKREQLSFINYSHLLIS
ncbi:MAG: hypothetical protein CM15mP93_07830 [Thiotrichaceae bacterium]|nr:MAG: hypothetical protein CM15mP93_07830 [Thiotrichaceae bacterium]